MEIKLEAEEKSKEKLFSETDVERLLKGEITPNEIGKLCKDAIEVLAEEPSLLSLSSDIVVVGDIHGQFFDFLNIFKVCPFKKYLFLGDYVDRGANSLETILLLLMIKTKHRDRVWLLRGNHESRQLSSTYGFYEECLHVYKSSVVWEMICEVFEYLPLAAAIDNTVFAVHGGIGPRFSLDALMETSRVAEIANTEALAAALWSDPDSDVEEYEENSRGAGFLFGEKQVDEFFLRTGFKKIIRSHQLVDEGYKEHFNGKVVTIWSAPNYCYRCLNKAMVGHITKEGIEYIEIPVAERQRGEPKPSLYFL
ncbi:serine/threonine-protein phosphatase 4 catalytic subunit [Nematocida sp. AWRm77]|nr:serine/threonine-protein phosphatase 4 catalytic subunit [Nematocida sp. AWRm77]